MLVMASLGLVGGGVAFFLLSQKDSKPEAEQAATTNTPEETPTSTPPRETAQTQPSPKPTPTPTPEPDSKEEQSLSKSESERVLEFYMQRLETAGEEPEGDLINEVLNLGFAVANEVQNIALDSLEMPEGWDEDYGDTLHKEMLKNWDLAKDPAGERRVVRLVRRLERFVPKGTPKFKVHLLADEDFNAFAVAGGHLYVTTGMLDFVKSDDELAAVLGHEMAHVYKGHCNRKLKILTLADAGLGDLGAMAANVGLLASAPFGKSDELEADAAGRQICTQAGFASEGMMRFLERMSRVEPDQENYLLKMMGTHPYTRERIDYLRQR